MQNTSRLHGYPNSLGPFGLKNWITSYMAVCCCCQQYKGTWVFTYSAQHFCPILNKFDFLNRFNPLNTELNPICHLLALLAHLIFHVSRIRVNENPVEATLIRVDRWTDGWLDRHDEAERQFLRLIKHT